MLWYLYSACNVQIEPRLTSKKFQAYLQTQGTTVSARTICRHLNEKGRYGRRPKRTLVLLFYGELESWRVLKWPAINPDINPQIPVKRCKKLIHGYRVQYFWPWLYSTCTLFWWRNLRHTHPSHTRKKWSILRALQKHSDILGTFP